MVHQIIEGRWYKIAKSGAFKCCQCGKIELYEIKIDKRGIVWMRIHLGR